MHFEVPQCTRCCFCIPMRYGIIIFGYLNLLLSSIIFSMMFWLISILPADEGSIILYHGVGISTQIWLGFVLYGLEVVFSVVLLFGAHLKNPKFMRVYYYYGITTTVASFVTFILLIDFYEGQHWDSSISEAAVAFCSIVLQIYLLLLIRSELEKLNANDGCQFVNGAGEITVHSPGMKEGEGRNPV